MPEKMEANMIESNSQNSKTTTENELKYAFTGEGELTHISEASSGMRENYLCPKCGSILMAKKGAIRTHHFAHYNAELCNGAQETALHLMAKDILLRNKCLYLPSDDTQGKAEIIQFDEVRLEQLAYGMVYDALGIFNKLHFAIEFYVTHSVDDIKRYKVEEYSVWMIEVDLSDYIGLNLTPLELEKIVLQTAPRHWINNHNTQKEDTRMSNKVTMTGFKLAHGYSRKYSSNFETNKIFIFQEIELKNSPNYSVFNCAGYNITELDVSDNEGLINKLSKWEYPREVTLSIDNVLKKGKISSLVIDIN